MKRYHHAKPPIYDLSKCNIKTAIFHGDMDSLSNPQDILWLISPGGESGFDSSLIIFNRELHFSHNTFTIGNDMSYVSDNVIPLIKGQKVSLKPHYNSLISQPSI